jgi:hypothetical protein
MGMCSIAGTCWKFCAPSLTATQSVARAQALLRCTHANGCGLQ